MRLTIPEFKDNIYKGEKKMKAAEQCKMEYMLGVHVKNK